MKDTAQQNDGWIPMETLFKFKRLASLTTDAEVVYEACKDSTVVTFDDAHTKAKRVTAPPALENDTYKLRSVDVLHLPDGVTIETVEAFFLQFGKVLSVRLRNRQGKFSNAARVEFATVEDADKVSAVRETNWTSGEKLTVIKVGSEKPKQEQKGKNKKGGKREDNKPTTYTPGTVLRLFNLPQDADRREFKSFLSKYGKVLYVDQNVDNKSLVRFLEAAGAQEALKEIQAKNVKFGDVVLEGEAMPGPEEEEYWNTKVLPGLAKPKTGYRR